jgi:acyl CoA:acetate/3-ketoacid CoA transferase beta subunit
MTDVTLGDMCAIACAEEFRGDGEIVATAFGVVPAVGARLARASFEPNLLLTDGEALFMDGFVSLDPATGVVEGYCPYGSMLDVAFSGRRHAIMGANQIDQYGNQNISNIGPWSKPVVQLAGFRGVPVNSINHTVSYWVPKHTPKTFVDRVDVVTGVGYDRAKALGRVGRFHAIRGVVTTLALLDFQTDDHRMRIRSVQPGVSVAEVRAATGFELVEAEGVTTMREPTNLEMELLERIDPGRRRDLDVT